MNEYFTQVQPNTLSLVPTDLTVTAPGPQVEYLQLGPSADPFGLMAPTFQTTNTVNMGLSWDDALAAAGATLSQGFIGGAVLFVFGLMVAGALLGFLYYRVMKQR